MWLSDWLGSVPARRLLGVPVIGICTMVSSPLKPMLLMGFLACVLLGHASAFEVEFYPLPIAPPTTNGAEARRISIGQFISELPRRNVYLNRDFSQGGRRPARAPKPGAGRGSILREQKNRGQLGPVEGDLGGPPTRYPG